MTFLKFVDRKITDCVLFDFKFDTDVIKFVLHEAV